jgi:hypothetical protein
MPQIRVGNQTPVSVTWKDLYTVISEIKGEFKETCNKLNGNTHYCCGCGGSLRKDYHDHTHYKCRHSQLDYCHGCGEECGDVFCQDCSEVIGLYTLTISEK